MAFTLRLTTEAEDKRTRLKAQTQEARKKRKASRRKEPYPQEVVHNRVEKTLARLAKSPEDPALKTHKYASLEHPWDPKLDVYSTRMSDDAQPEYHVFWCFGPGKKELTIIAIVS